MVNSVVKNATRRDWALAAGLGDQTPGLTGPAAAQAQPIYIEVEPSELQSVVGFAALPRNSALLRRSGDSHRGTSRWREPSTPSR